MTAWAAIVGATIGGLAALAGAALSQVWTKRREHEGRVWDRRVECYTALLRWRLAPPDDERIADPASLADARQAWVEALYPLLAELSLFAGPRIEEALGDDAYVWQSAPRMASMTSREIATRAREDLLGVHRSAQDGKAKRRDAPPF